MNSKIAETDLYCSGCGDKIYDKDDKMMYIAPFRGNSENCSNCDTVLRRRSPGGQSDTWGFTSERTITKVKWGKDICKLHSRIIGTIDCESCGHGYTGNYTLKHTLCGYR